MCVFLALCVCQPKKWLHGFPMGDALRECVTVSERSAKCVCVCVVQSARSVPRRRRALCSERVYRWLQKSSGDAIADDKRVQVSHRYESVPISLEIEDLF